MTHSMRAGFAFAAALSLFTDVSHAVPDSYTSLSPMSTDSSWVFDVPAGGLLQFESLLVPLGVSAAFQGSSSQISLFASNEIRIDGSLNVGNRSLSLNAPRITFGPEYFLTSSGARLDINSTAFDGGANFNPRGEVYLNGQRISTGGTLPGETFGGIVLTFQQVDLQLVPISVGPSDFCVGASMHDSPSPSGRGVGVREETWILSLFSLTSVPLPVGEGSKARLRHWHMTHTKV